MPGQSHNEGFRILEDFVCDAIHNAAVEKGASVRQARSEGIRVVPERVIDLLEEGVCPKREPIEDVPEAVSPLQDEPGVAKDTVDRLLSVIGEIPSDYRSVLLLRLSGLSLAEISELLGIAADEAAARIHRMLRRVRDQSSTRSDE